MREVKKTSQFKKDFKRIQHDATKVKALFDTVQLLANDVPLPESMHPHLLSGKYKGFMECHIGPDYLLIWFDQDQNVIDLVRLGSHSELFK